MPRPSMVSGADGEEETAAPGLLKGRKRIAAMAIASNVRLGGIRGRILQVVIPSAAKALGLKMVTYGLKAVPFYAASFELSFRPRTRL